MSEILWQPNPEAAATTALVRFARQAGFEPDDYEALHRWSVSDKGAFWSLVWDFCEVIGDKGNVAFRPDEGNWMTGARFFPEANLNLAENLLLRGGDADVAIIASDESGAVNTLTRRELRGRVARVADGLRRCGVVPGDRVAGVQGNTPDALVATLATLSLGAVWTSCSPDFGLAAILDRIGQVQPKVLFVSPEYRYGGKTHDISERIAKVVEELPDLAQVVSSGATLPGAANQSEFGETAELSFTRVPFDHPAYILYTSGTTGAPKAIVHRTGGVILQHLKEHILHGDVRPPDRVIWYTNTAWMMYHWQISALATGAAVVLYDGAPVIKSENGLDCSPLWRLVSNASVTHLGVSPKYLSVLAAEGFLPGERHTLDSLRALLVCGAPCLPHQFDWVFDSVKRDMMFASISGGTEILGSFLIGSPIHPVRRGELSVQALGHAMSVLDERNAPVTGKRGELVCTEPFPSMPLTFWGEDGKKRFHDTYFSERTEIWTHGDIAEMTISGGAYVHGRSDSTLNPGGVRIGISEIYAVCERHPEIEDYVVFGARTADDEEIVLALKPAEAANIDAELVRRLRADIRRDASPRHVPARIHVVSAIPYTINGKRVESAARMAANGDAVRNLGSLANPECLDEFAGLSRKGAL